MSDEQWMAMWRKWTALPARAKARYLRMSQHRQANKALPF